MNKRPAPFFRTPPDPYNAMSDAPEYEARFQRLERLIEHTHTYAKFTFFVSGMAVCYFLYWSLHR